MMLIQTHKPDAIFIFFCGVILFTLGLQHQEIIGFESRFYLFALEMWRHGFTWFPTTYQEPYPDYPVTSTALIYFTAKLFGTLNKWIAVLPSAVAAALTLSATYLIGATENRKWGWYSVGFLLFTVAFLTEARTISLDMYVAAVTTWVFYIAWSAKSHMRMMNWLLISLFMIFSFAIRGPVGIIIPAGVLCVFYVLEKNWKSFLGIGFLSLFLLITCTAILLCAAWHTGGDAFMQNVIHMQFAGRMEVNRTPPHYFYFIESIGAYAVTYPLFICILAGTLPRLITKKSESARLIGLLIGWIFVIMIGLSIPADKKVRYILAIAPALSLMSAYLFATEQKGFLSWIREIFHFIFCIFPMLALGVLFLLHKKQIALDYQSLSITFILIQLLMIIFQKNAIQIFLAVTTFYIANIYIVEKINLQQNKTRDFVQQIEKSREKANARLAFYHEGRDGLAIKYLINMKNDETPLFISDIKHIPKARVFLITSKENYEAFPKKVQKSFRIIAEGMIGRDNVVVFAH